MKILLEQIVKNKKINTCMMQFQAVIAVITEKKTGCGANE